MTELSNATVIARHELAEKHGYKLERLYETDRRGLPIYRLRMASNWATTWSGREFLFK